MKAKTNWSMTRFNKTEKMERKIFEMSQENSSLEQKCSVELLLSTLAKDNWTLVTAHDLGQYTYANAYHFTRPVQAS
jgi:hypothetical protein